jgi:GTP-binding protein
VGEEGKLTKIWKRSGTGRIDLELAGAGDIVSVTGLASARIADTVGSMSLLTALAPGAIEPPTLRSGPPHPHPSPPT